MTGYLGNAYYWVLAGHIIFIIFLMAGLFMMPRFFIYHQECAIGSTEEVRWIRREGRLRKIRSEEHTSELQSLMRISYAVFCLKKKNPLFISHDSVLEHLNVSI